MFQGQFSAIQQLLRILNVKHYITQHFMTSLIDYNKQMGVFYQNLFAGIDVAGIGVAGISVTFLFNTWRPRQMAAVF